MYMMFVYESSIQCMCVYIVVAWLPGKGAFFINSSFCIQARIPAIRWPVASDRRKRIPFPSISFSKVCTKSTGGFCKGLAECTVLINSSRDCCRVFTEHLLTWTFPR